MGNQLVALQGSSQQSARRISNTTVWRELKADKAHPYHRMPEPKLTAEYKRKRLAWVFEHHKDKWTSVVFSDEKNFTLYHRPNVHNDIVWAYSPD